MNIWFWDSSVPQQGSVRVCKVSLAQVAPPSSALPREDKEHQRLLVFLYPHTEGATGVPWEGTEALPVPCSKGRAGFSPVVQPSLLGWSVPNQQRTQEQEVNSIRSALKEGVSMEMGPGWFISGY